MRSFGKQHSCPTSDEILSLSDGSINNLTRQNVEQHAQLCDFCNAELQLFKKYPPSGQQYTPAQVPLFVNVLAINSPAVRSYAVQQARAA